ALAAAGVPGVRAVLGRVVNARGEPRSGWPPVAVELEVVTEYGDSAVEVGEAARRRVRAELATLAGVDAETVDVTVEDVAGTRVGHRPARPGGA
ncbi:MAG TPA: Asp23/Gls24 family envelope stress response protein, partial [Actinomycetota bacterium]|nr:Asp23/Gls24 family envelope stress response protein [Actinomycetota bacterium]